jgi:hypothetical protein
MVVAWMASCDSGSSIPMAIELTAMQRQPGFSPGPADLMMSRNAKGRFAGTQVAGRDFGDVAALISARYSGRFRGRRASGSLAAEVQIVDAAGGEQVDSCSTGTRRWSASRARGRVFGGRTSQDEPIVLRLDAARKTVSDVLLAWSTETCEPPDNAIRVWTRFSGFRLRGGGAFGDSFTSEMEGDDVAYEIGGRIGRRSARGKLRARMTDRDPSGATVLTCDSGTISWTAATG